jgi:hypothetical protein
MHPQDVDSVDESLRRTILEAVLTFVNETGISETSLSRGALNDGSAIARLRAGKSITLRNADRIYAFMAADRARRAETTMETRS